MIRGFHSAILLGLLCGCSASYAKADNSETIVTVGAMSIRNTSDGKIILSGWPRKNSDISVIEGQCDVVATVVDGSQGVLRFNGKLAMRMETSPQTGMITGARTVTDANGCRWRFEESVPFKVNGVLLTPSEGATVQFEKDGTIITRGIDFSDP